MEVAARLDWEMVEEEVWAVSCMVEFSVSERKVDEGKGRSKEKGRAVEA